MGMDDFSEKYIIWGDFSQCPDGEKPNEKGRKGEKKGPTRLTFCKTFGGGNNWGDWFLSLHG